MQSICIENEKLNQFINEKMQEIAQLQDLEMKIQNVAEENEHVHRLFEQTNCEIACLQEQMRAKERVASENEMVNRKITRELEDRADMLVSENKKLSKLLDQQQ